jgi:aspartate racemase
MKTIGLLGGMSWESTAIYYSEINKYIQKTLGGLHSAKIILNSIDFDIIAKLQKEENWEEAIRILSKEALKLQLAGADFLVICTNTMHKIAPEIEEALDIPLLHIADATAKVILENNIQKVGLLGTAFTMEQDFYKTRLIKNYNLDVLIPNKKDIKTVHNIIFQELCLGKINSNSKKEYLRIIDLLANQGAKAIILGCTEIGMLIKQKDTKVKLFNTTIIHAQKSAQYAID